MNLELIGLILVVCTLIIVTAIGSIFEECKKKGYLAMIPIVNVMVLLRITVLPRWWIFPLLIPGLNIYYIYRIFLNLSIGFGREKSFALKILLLPFVYLPLLAYYSKYEDRYKRRLILDYQGLRNLKASNS